MRSPRRRRNSAAHARESGIQFFRFLALGPRFRGPSFVPRSNLRNSQETGRSRMAYDLDQFIADTRATLKRDPGPAGREKVRSDLERLLANKDFVAQTCGENVPTGLK